MYYPFTEALIRTRAKYQLAAAQWPDDFELCYSLSCCQGDGVSFTGCLSTSALLRLVPCLQSRGLLTAGQASTLLCFIPLHHSTVQFLRREHRYCHAGTVTAVMHDFPEELDDTEAALLSALTLEFEAICARTELDGYRIIEATHPADRGETLFVRRTANIELSAVVPDPCDFGCCDDEADVLTRYLELIFEQGARVPGIELQIRCNGQLMARSWIEHVVILPDAPVRAWLSRDDVSYIAGEARSAIGEQVAAFHSFFRRAA